MTFPLLVGITLISLPATFGQTSDLRIKKLYLKKLRKLPNQSASLPRVRAIIKKLATADMEDSAFYLRAAARKIEPEDFNSSMLALNELLIENTERTAKIYADKIDKLESEAKEARATGNDAWAAAIEKSKEDLLRQLDKILQLILQISPATTNMINTRG